jgi:hypothetical protein
MGGMSDPDWLERGRLGRLGRHDPRLEGSDRPPAAVPVSVLEALASEWDGDAERLRANAAAAVIKPGDGMRRARLYAERCSALADCARDLREVMARSGQESDTPGPQET